MPGVVQPEEARQAVGVPGGEEGGGEADQVVEDGHADGQHEGDGHHGEDECGPDQPSQSRVRVQVPRVPEDAHEEQLGRRVRVQAACDQEVGDGEAVGGFLPDFGQGGEGGGGDGGAKVVVGYDGEDGVEGCCEPLEEVSGLHGVLRAGHFGDQYEKHEVARVGEDGVGDADEGGYKVARQRDGDDAVRHRVRGPGGPAAPPRYQDAAGAARGQPCQAVQGAGQREKEGGDGEDARVEEQAERVGREGAERNLARQQLRAGAADGEDDGAPGQHLAADGPKEDVTGVAHGVN